MNARPCVFCHHAAYGEQLARHNTHLHTCTFMCVHVCLHLCPCSCISRDTTCTVSSCAVRMHTFTERSIPESMSRSHKPAALDQSRESHRERSGLCRPLTESLEFSLAKSERAATAAQLQQLVDKVPKCDRRVGGDCVRGAYEIEKPQIQICGILCP